jgi:hypothetical protein
MLVSAMIFPWNVVPVPRVAELPTCHSSLTACAFSGTVEVPKGTAGAAEFGIAITGGGKEERSQRSISGGKIQIQ